MTLKELVHSCNFEDLLPAILKLMSKNKDCKREFKIVFDTLRHTEPKSTSIKILIITHDEYVRVSCIDPDGAFCYPWDESLGMEVILEGNVQLSTIEIVAHCIWEMTFLGFSWDRILHRFDRGVVDRSEEGRKAAKLKLKALRFKYPISAKSDFNNREEVLLNPDNFGIEAAEGFRYLRRQRPMNRSKRKRLYRWEKRIKYLERKSKIKSAIKRVTTDSTIKETELAYLFDTKLNTERGFESCAESIQTRAQYLVELFTEYADEDLTAWTKFCFLFRTSSQHPITEAEKEVLEKIKTVLPPTEEIRFDYGVNDALGEKMSVLRIMSRI
jgi:hypothetical protein